MGVLDYLLNAGYKIYDSIITNKLTKYYRDKNSTNEDPVVMSTSLKFIIEKQRIQYWNTSSLHKLQKTIWQS
jgi:hypothetical protein